MPEPGLVIELREEMFNDTRFGAEVFYMHVRGVDTIFVLSYVHILKKCILRIMLPQNLMGDYLVVTLFSDFIIS
jgi:hypothetical protein